MLISPFYNQELIVNIYRHCCRNDGHWPDSILYVMLRVERVDGMRRMKRVIMGHAVNSPNSMLRSINGNTKKKRLIICHQNLMGGHMVKDKKMVEVNSIITATEPDILGISEPELDDDMMMACHVEGYVWERKSDSTRLNVLVNSNLDYKRRKDLERDSVAAIWIEINPRQKKSLLVCNVYREWKLLGDEASGSRAAQEDRWRKFIAVLKSVADSGQELHVLGDMNINRERWRQVALNKLDEEEDDGYGTDDQQLLNPQPQQSKPRKAFKQEWYQVLVDILYEEVLCEHPEIVQLIKKPTWFRQTEDRGLIQSCLDLYFTNQPHKISNLNLVQIAKSDHMMIVSQRISKTKIPKPSIIRKRQWSKVNWGLLRTQMAMTSFEEDILSCEDPEVCTQRLTAVIRVHLDVHARVKCYQVKKRFCPWVDEVAKLTIQRKQKLHAAWKKSGKEEDKKKYRDCSNFLSWDLRRKKSAYIQQRLRSTCGSKDVWKAAKSQVGWQTSSAPTSLSINGHLTSKNEEMAQAQNEFFDQKPKNIAKKIPKTDKDPLDYTRDFLKDKDVPEFNMQEVTEYDVMRIIGELNESDACGLDDISTNCLKEISGVIAKSLAHIINLCFRLSYFPRMWKSAKTSPLFKNNGDRTEMKNYRPIALLPSLSKVLEKAVAEKLVRHLESNGLLSDKQHGYRSKRSTATCLLQLQETITTRFEKGQDTALLCFDSSAAFDTLSHNILLAKLALYGVSEQALGWFRSYLSDREQCCEIGGKRSTFTKIGQGVFQGSVLGPILYILYVNCIVTLEDIHTKLSLYADDTTAATALSKDKSINQKRIKDKAAQMQEYMDANLLKFNGDKTQLLIKHKGRNNMHKELTLEMASGTIEQSDVVKVLGVYLSRDELYKEYLITSDNSMMKFLETRLKMLKILSRHADEKSRKLLAEGLILSKINYCISLWGTTLVSIMDKFDKFINKVCRVVLNRRMTARVIDMYKELRWLTVWQTRTYHDIIQLNTILKYKTPQDLAAKFEPDAPHGHNTRSSQRPLDRNSKTRSTDGTRQKSFVCRAAKLYENLPPILKKTNPPRAVFKDTVRCNIGGFEYKERTMNYYIRQVCQNKAKWGEWEG